MTENSERADVQPRLWSRRGYSQSLRFARELSYGLTALAVGGVIVFLLRRWYLRNTPLAMAKAAHLKWLSHPENPRSLRESYRSVARLIEWFDALPVEQRTDICRQLGLTIESDHFDETGLHRFSIAHHSPCVSVNAFSRAWRDWCPGGCVASQ